MQNLTDIVRTAKRAGNFSDQQIINQVREYLQVLILKAIYQSKYGRGLSFAGGTCLRICYTLKRFSEDLDFCLDAPVPKYSFQDLNETVIRFLEQKGFPVDGHVREDKVVQKSFIRFSQVLSMVGARFQKDQKLHIKLEIDTRPVPVMDKDRESFFVTKFDENFPILKHTNETLFAGKILAVLNRAYTKGRDYYDLIWYLTRKTKINLPFLNEGNLRQGVKKPFQDVEEVSQTLSEKVASVSPNAILKDIGPFLEDPNEAVWIKNYQQYFRQVLEQYLSES
ncbi:MAG: nucleotidyl transferase AbiEii/AbiGii toxin family protein [Deltaproteobacteria bacterium]|nr:nucleotidyl transferase AbiEii/AbiGii toxin family protein [Deltaproteobacteria bacterium]